MSKSAGRILPWFICTLAALFYCYEYLLRIEPSVMVPELMHAFSINATGIGMLAAIYFWVYTPLQLVVGVATDYFGPRKILLMALLSCTVGSLLFGLSHFVWVAAMGRVLIGLGSAFAFVGVLKLAAMWLPQRFFAMFAGLATSLGMLGAMVGDVEMSHLVRHMGWHSLLLWSAILGFVLLPIFFLFLREKAVAHESHTMRNLMAGLKRLLGRGQIWFAGFIGCLLYLSLTVFAGLWGIPFLHAAGFHAAAPRINSMIFLGWLVGSPLVGWLSDGLGSRKGMMIVGALLSAGSISLVLLWPHMASGWLMLLLFLFGLFSSVEILSFVIARELVEVKLAATAIGLVNLLIMLSGMIFQPLVGRLLDVVWRGTMENGIRVYSLHDYRVVLLVLPVGMVLAAVCGLFLRQKEVCQQALPVK